MKDIKNLLAVKKNNSQGYESDVCSIKNFQSKTQGSIYNVMFLDFKFLSFGI